MRADLRVTLKGGQLPVETTATDQTAVKGYGGDAYAEKGVR